MAESTAPGKHPDENLAAESPGPPLPRPEAAPREAPPPIDLNLIRGGATVLAVLGIIALLYFAASVFITLFSALLLAFGLEPLVHILCVRTRLRRPHASGIVVFLFIAFLYGLAWITYGMAEGFLKDLPLLVEKFRATPFVAKVAVKVQETARLFEEAGARFLPAPTPGWGGEALPQVVVREVESAGRALFRNLGSLSGVLFSLCFVPFLVYFMLAEREPLTRRTRELFPEEYHQRVGVILLDMERVMRRFLIGNAILIGILVVATILVFRILGLPSAVVLGALSGTLSVVPYLGLPLALLPGIAVGLVSFTSGTPLLLLVLAVTVFHLVSANYLTPKLVGREVHLNATASTAALLFFGWLWGGMGLLLGIPILAVVKCVLYNVPSTRRVGIWLGD
jgi:predicted PurR-regulated permease PerM